MWKHPLFTFSIAHIGDLWKHCWASLQYSSLIASVPVWSSLGWEVGGADYVWPFIFQDCRGPGYSCTLLMPLFSRLAVPQSCASLQKSLGFKYLSSSVPVVLVHSFKNLCLLFFSKIFIYLTCYGWWKIWKSGVHGVAESNMSEQCWVLLRRGNLSSFPATYGFFFPPLYSCGTQDL